jgi:lysophospholipase L1-like esterase
LRRLGGIALSIALTLAGLELGLRAFSWVVLRARAGKVEQSSDPKTIRILHLGESTTYAFGVAAAEAYPAVAERLLESRVPGAAITTFNRGLPGSTSAALVQRLARELELVRPQLVVILAGANDFSERLNPFLMDGIWSVEGHLPRWILELRLWKLGALLLDLTGPKARWGEGELLYYRHAGSKNILYGAGRDPIRAREVSRRLRANLRRMIALCRRQRAAVILLGYLKSPEENRRIQAVARQAGIQFVSCSVDSTNTALFLPDGWHPSAAGHRRMAQKLATTLRPWAQAAQGE